MGESSKSAIPKHPSRRPLPEHAPYPLPEREPLGIAGGMARFFIDSPLTPMLMMFALALGVLGLYMTPRQEDPQISVPMIDIFFEYPGASAEQVANLAIQPLERIMSEITGVKHVYSAAERETGIVTVRFKVGEPMEPSVVKVHEKLQSNLDLIPPQVSMPLVKPRRVDDVPVVTVTLWSPEGGMDDGKLRTLAFDVLQRLEEVKDTGPGFVVGGQKSQIRVEVLAESLAGFQMSLDDVAETIRQANAERGSGSLEMSNRVFKVSSGA